MLFSYFLLGLGWTLFYVLHSLLAATYIKHYLQTLLGKYQPYYRLLYNAFAGIFFIALLFFQFSLPNQFVYQSPFMLKLMGILGIFLGLIILMLSFRNYNLSEFIGTEQLRQKESSEHSQLLTTGLNAWVRHPIYFGTLLGMLGYLLISPTIKNLIFFTCFSIYLLIGTYIEERKLLIIFGEEYRHYQHKVRMLIPFIF